LLLLKSKAYVSHLFSRIWDQGMGDDVEVKRDGCSLLERWCPWCDFDIGSFITSVFWPPIPLLLRLPSSGTAKKWNQEFHKIKNQRKFDEVLGTGSFPFLLNSISLPQRQTCSRLSFHARVHVKYCFPAPISFDTGTWVFPGQDLQWPAPIGSTLDNTLLFPRSRCKESRKAKGVTTSVGRN